VSSFQLVQVNVYNSLYYTESFLESHAITKKLLEFSNGKSLFYVSFRPLKKSLVNLNGRQI